jgi:membrane protein YdbS with pleckstrin-like domain
MVKENTEVNVNNIETVSPIFGKDILVSGEKIITESRPVVWSSSLRPLILIIIGVLVNWLTRYFRPEYLKVDYIANTGWIDTVILWIGPAIMIIGAFSLLIRWIRRNYTIYALTNKRILRRSGVFSRAYLNCSLGKVQNVEVLMSPVSRVFKFGHIRIATARTKGADIEWLDVKNPIGLQRQINEALENYLKENNRPGLTS